MKDLRLMGPLCLKYKLYKYHLIIFTSLLSFCFVFVCQAQEVALPATPAAKANNEAVDLTLLGIQIGEKVPDITISNIHNYKSSTVKLSDFKGKLLILDFWATWCSPCVAMIPKMDSLQKVFGDEVQFLSVTYQKEDEVLSFLEKLEKMDDRKYGIPMAMEDKQLRYLFPHKFLPHYVWIDADGVLQYITGREAINVDNISQVLNKREADIVTKNDGPKRDYNPRNPLFFDDRNCDKLIQNTTWTGYIDGLGAGFSHNILSKDPRKLKHITARNLTIPKLYQLAFTVGTASIRWNRTILSVRDTSLIRNRSVGREYAKWLEDGNGFCYELMLPGESQDAFLIMKQDIQRRFPLYTASMEKVKSKAFVLTRNSKMNLMKSKGGKPKTIIDSNGCIVENKTLSEVLNYLEFYLNVPLVNETGYNDMVDLDINADLKDVASINAALEKYEIEFLEGERLIDFLVIKDAPSNN